jgi:hypothetical protein
MLAGVGACENDGEDYDRAVLAMVVVASTEMGFRMIIWLNRAFEAEKMTTAHELAATMRTHGRTNPRWSATCRAAIGHPSEGNGSREPR